MVKAYFYPSVDSTLFQSVCACGVGEVADI